MSTLPSEFKKYIELDFVKFTEKSYKNLEVFRTEFEITYPKEGLLFEEYMILLDKVIDYEDQIQKSSSYVTILNQNIEELENTITEYKKEKEELLKYKDRLERISSSFLYKVYSFLKNIFRSHR